MSPMTFSLSIPRFRTAMATAIVCLCALPGMGEVLAQNPAWPNPWDLPPFLDELTDTADDVRAQNLPANVEAEIVQQCFERNGILRADAVHLPKCKSLFTFAVTPDPELNKYAELEFKERYEDFLTSNPKMQQGLFPRLDEMVTHPEAGPENVGARVYAESCFLSDGTLPFYDHLKLINLPNHPIEQRTCADGVSEAMRSGATGQILTSL